MKNTILKDSRNQFPAWEGIIKITGINEKQQQVELVTSASSAQELVKKLKDVLDKKSKNSILDLIGWK